MLGPLSTSLGGLKLFTKPVMDAEPWVEEPALIPLPWRRVELPKDTKEGKLRIRVLWHDQVILPHPPITRALEMLTVSLKKAGMEVVDFRPHPHDEAWANLSALYFTDGGEADANDIDSSGGPWRPLSTWILKENDCVRKLSVGELTYWLEVARSVSKRVRFALEQARRRCVAMSGRTGRSTEA